MTEFASFAPDRLPSQAPIDPANARIGRTVAGMVVSNVGALVALLTPLSLLLTLHLVSIAGSGAAAGFSVVTGFGALIALFANPLGGRLSDRTVARFGRRRTWILTGAVIGSAILFVLPFTTQVWEVAILWCFVQLTFNFQQAATTALLADQIPQRRRGTVSGIVGLAAVLGPLIGLTAVSFVKDPTVQWAIAGGAGILGGVISVLIIRDRGAERREKSEQRARFSLAEIPKTFWFNPARYPALGFAWLIRFLLTCGLVSGTYNALLLINHFGVPAKQVSTDVLLISVVTTLAMAITAVVAGMISDKIRRQKPFVVVSGILMAGAMVLIALAPNESAVMIAAVPLGIGGGFFLSVDIALCARVLPDSTESAKDLGILNIANTLPQSIVPFVAPLLIALGGYPAIYVTLAIFALAGGLLVVRLPEIGHEGDPRWALLRTFKPGEAIPVIESTATPSAN